MGSTSPTVRSATGRLGLVAIPVLALAACAFRPDATRSLLPSATASATPPASTSPNATATSDATPAATPEPVATILAAGDIAACDHDRDGATAALIADRDGLVATLGDNVYPVGSDATYAECYAPAWGSFLDRTRPAIGNHDVQDDNGAAYYRYFGERAGNRGDGWYSYDHGAWHVVVLNSNCTRVGCDLGSPQIEWLVADLAASDARCILAYWHHPRFSSGMHGDDARVAHLWRALDMADADLVLAGHDHLYERFAPQTAEGLADPDGVRQITAGTGGAGLYRGERVAPNSELWIDDAFGVLVLTLREASYDWSFVTTAGVEADAGSADCV